MNNRDDIVIPALDKALTILEYIAERKCAMIRDIVNELGIAQTTAFRTVKYLTMRGYLTEDRDEPSVYRLGPQIYKQFHSYIVNTDLTERAKTYLNQLCVQCAQTAQLALLKDDGIVYIDQSLPSNPVSIVAPLHTIVPVNVSASGKVLVAALNGIERQQYVNNCTLVDYTVSSITSRDLFADELEAVSQRGYAVDNEEYAIGIGCVAAPVRNYTGKVCAAIGITGHITDYQDHVEFLANTVLNYANRLSQSLGYSDD